MFNIDNYSFNILSYSVAFINFLIAATAFAAFKRPEKPTYRLFSIYAVLTWIYAAGYLLQTMSLSLDQKVFWANIKVTSVCFVPMVWIWITCLMTNRKMPGKFFNMLMVAVAVANVAVIWTDGHTHIFRSSVTLLKVSEEFYIMKPTFGLWFKTIYMYSLYVPTIISLMMFAVSFMNTGRSGRMQYGMMMAGMLTSLFGGTPQVMHLTNIDTYPFAAGFTMIIYFIIIHKYHLFDIVPMAKSAVLDIIRSAVLIYDNRGRLSERNSFSKELMPDDKDVANITALCRKLGFDLNDLEYGRELNTVLEYPESGRVFSVSLMIISETGRNVDGYLVFSTDITEHRKLNDIKHENAMLEHKNIIIGDIHDSISGSITIMAMLASQDIETLEEAHAALNQIEEIAQDASKEIRFLMNSYEKNDPSMRDFAGDLRHIGNMLTEGTGIEFGLDTRIDNASITEVSFKNYLNIVRFFRESIINSVKHSKADKISASVTTNNNNIIITIQDNGTGFDPSSKRGRGIKNMFSRINGIGGTVTINSSGGTKISAEIPSGANNGI